MQKAHHTTAIFYQVIIDLHQTLCTVAPKVPSFLSSPNFLWKAKKSWAWFCCSWAEGLGFFLVLLHPKFKVFIKNPTDSITNSFSKRFPSSREAKAFREWIPSCVLCREPQNLPHTKAGRDIWGGSGGAAVTGVGKKTLSILLQCPKWTCSTFGAFFGAPWPWQAQLFVPLCPSGSSGV